MRKYEAMYIIRPDVEEAARKEIITYLSEIFTKMDSKVTDVKELGMKSLAYEIRHNSTDLKQGYYVVMNVEATNEAVNEFDRLIKINEQVIRHIVVRIDETKAPVIKPDTRPKREPREAKKEE